MEGWIKLYRKSIDSAVFQNEKLWKVWTYCLMRANHKERKIIFMGKEININPGQFITGRFEGAKDCNMKPSTFRDQLDKLKKMKNLDIISDNYSTSNRQQPDTDKNERMKKCNKNTFSIENLPIGLNGELFLKTKFFYVTKSLISELREKLQLQLTDTDLHSEFYKMEVSLETNKSKKNYKMFFANWLKRAKPNGSNEFNNETAGQSIPAAHQYL